MWRSYFKTFGVSCLVWLLVVGQLLPVPAEAGKKDMEKKYNRLKSEKSPYLLQHADNPVEWYPWGSEAFEKALKENKPIFLSIGYSTCHWCHVMAHESFEDPEVARLMNEVFISIKVDREERPDIDNIYMTVCQMMTGSGGWPLTIIMTPDKKPFFAGTYFPKENRFGRPGMLELVPRIKSLWLNEKERLLDIASNSAASLVEKERPISDNKTKQKHDNALFQDAYAEFDQMFDQQRGGFGSAPKFPTPHRIFYLLRYWKRTGDKKALGMVEKTLEQMRLGGIYDHIGYGFHRYSTDAFWLVPHFEKMLYDQALLAMAYSEAFQATGNAVYRQTAEEIFAYVARDMTSPAGGFYSAQDADSEGEEGRFYVWTEDDIRKTVGPEDADLILKIFNIEKKGNFIDQAAEEKTGTNIIHLRKSPAEIASGLKMSVEDFKKRLETARQKLFDAREKRVHPHKDDKILTDWNGLMIAALAKGAQVFDNPSYAKRAKQAADFILKNMRSADGRLLHRYRDGEAAVKAHIDDYAFLIWGLIEIYEASFETGYLKKALELNDDMVKHFWDNVSGGFYFSPGDAEDMLVRQKMIYDGAVPSGNSVAMLNLLRLGRMTGRPDLENKAMQAWSFFYEDIRQSPSAYTYAMMASDFGTGPSYEVVVAGDSNADDTQAMLKALGPRFVPNKVVLLRPTETEAPDIIGLAGFTKYQKAIDGRAAAYVCLNYNCQFPTTEIREMLDLLEGKSVPAVPDQP